MHELAGKVSVNQVLQGRPGDLKTGGDFVDRSSCISDESRDFQAVERCKDSIRVYSRPELLG